MLRFLFGDNMKLTYKHTVISCYLANITCAILNNLAPLLFVTLQDQFSLSTAQLGSIIFVNFGLQIFVDLIGSKYVDAIGLKKCVVASQAFAVVGLCLLSVLPQILSNKYIAVIISVCIYAIGSGIMEISLNTIVDGIPHDSENIKNSKISFLHSAYCWGHVLVVLLSTVFFVTAGRNNWSVLVLLWLIVPLITGVMFCFVPINEHGAQHATENSTFKGLLKNKLFWVFLVLMICAGSCEQAMGQWSSYFAEKGLHVSKTLGDLLGTCLFALLMALSRTFYGALSHRINLKKFLLLSSAACLISYLVASLATNSIVCLLACGLCGLSVGIMWPGVIALAANSSLGGSTAMFGLLALGGDAGCTLGPQLMSVLSSFLVIHGSGMKGGLLCSALFPIAMLLTLTIFRNLSKTTKKTA